MFLLLDNNKSFSFTAKNRYQLSRKFFNKLPKGQHVKAKAALHEIWMAESRATAEQAFDHFLFTRRLRESPPGSSLG